MFLSPTKGSYAAISTSRKTIVLTANDSGVVAERKTVSFAMFQLPVERRKRYVYVVHCPDAPMFDFPFVVDPSGVYVRREGFAGKYVCGASPLCDVSSGFKHACLWLN